LSSYPPFKLAGLRGKAKEMSQTKEYNADFRFYCEGEKKESSVKYDKSLKFGLNFLWAFLEKQVKAFGS